MAVCQSNRLDSNATGLRYAEEECLRQLPANVTWHGLEPNSYNDFGGTITTQAREPISASRQREKGVVTDLEASGGFQQDLTIGNTWRLLQGFLFADARERPTTMPLNGAPVALTAAAAADKSVAAAAGLAGFKKGYIVQFGGFTKAENNVRRIVAADATATKVTFKEAVSDETPPVGAYINHVGIKFDTSALNAVMNGKLFQLTGSNLNTYGFVPGEWVFIGGDDPTSRFANNTGFARISVVTPNAITFDKTDFAAQAEVGTNKSIEIYVGSIIRNEAEPSLIKRRSYQLERYLGKDKDGDMSEYLVGAVPNEMTVNVSSADKVTVDMSFMALDSEQRDGKAGLKTGTRPISAPESAFNTSSDVHRIKLAEVVDESAVKPLYAFATELSISVNNNVSASKAIGTLGAIDTTAGMFEVGGNMTAYFADISAVKAVRNNADITLDMVMLKRNSGMVWDIPLLTLGNGRLTVEKDQAIMLPLDTNAVKGKFGYTLQIQRFSYLPNVAGGV